MGESDCSDIELVLPAVRRRLLLSGGIIFARCEHCCCVLLPMRGRILLCNPIVELLELRSRHVPGQRGGYSLQRPLPSGVIFDRGQRKQRSMQQMCGRVLRGSCGRGKLLKLRGRHVRSEHGRYSVQRQLPSGINFVSREHQDRALFSLRGRLLLGRPVICLLGLRGGHVPGQHGGDGVFWKLICGIELTQ